MKTPLAIGLLLALGGCATHNCEEGAWACQQQQLLYQNDLMQAKVLITSGDKDSLELASALLDRIQEEDQRGEVDFYRALLLIRRTPEDTQAIIFYLERAGLRQHPHAIALLYRMHYEPYLLKQRDLARADIYRKRYAQLDVARSGYPSFEQAVVVANRLFAAPLIEAAAAQAKAQQAAAVAPVAPAPAAATPAPAPAAKAHTPTKAAEASKKKPASKTKGS